MKRGTDKKICTELFERKMKYVKFVTQSYAIECVGSFLDVSKVRPNVEELLQSYAISRAGWISELDIGTQQANFFLVRFAPGVAWLTIL